MSGPTVLNRFWTAVLETFYAIFINSQRFCHIYFSLLEMSGLVFEFGPYVIVSQHSTFLYCVSMCMYLQLRFKKAQKHVL